jgi:uncharacterized protein (DUF433 family)
MAAKLRIDPHVGVYNASRAAALAGVPERTLSDWAKKGLYTPSIDPDPRTRLWSWSDLLALRAIHWMRHRPDGGSPVTVRKIRTVLAELGQTGRSPHELHHLALVSSGGHVFLQFTEEGPVMHATPGHQLLIPDTLNPVRPYLGNGPDLLEPRPLVRIIPGKLHGEPHVASTRIPTATVYALDQDGYTADQILTMYPQLSPEALDQAIDLERSLHTQAA